MITQPVNIRFFNGVLSIYDASMVPVPPSSTAAVSVNQVTSIADVPHLISVPAGSTTIPLAAIPAGQGVPTGVQGFEFTAGTWPVITKLDGTPASSTLFIAAKGLWQDNGAQ